jgi:hypothetical protein
MTPQAGLSYNLRVGTSVNNGDIVSPNKFPGTGNMLFNTTKTIKNTSDGKYYIQVQASDHSMMPGNWSKVSTVTVTTSEGITFEVKDVILSVNGTSQLSIKDFGSSNLGKGYLQTSSSQAAGYLWTSSNPDVVQVSQSGVVTALKLGFAVITVQNPDDLSKKATCIVTVDNSIPVGIKDTDPNMYNANENSIFKVFPNPSSGEIYIELKEPEVQSFEMFVVNQFGAVVKRVKLMGQTNVKLDLSQLPNGLYLVTLHSESGTYSKKVIIQK